MNLDNIRNRAFLVGVGLVLFICIIIIGGGI